MAIRAGLVLIPLSNAPCVKCGHPDLLQEVISIEFSALGEETSNVYRYECAACGHPIFSDPVRLGHGWGLVKGNK